MQRFGRLSGLGLLVVIGCGGANPAPPKPASPAASAIAKEPVEKADLSPVAAPEDLFVVGRLKRPGPIADTLGRWAGLPVNLRTLLAGEFPALDGVIAWDAPVELAIALPSGERRHGVRTIVSVGVNSLGAALSAARDRGLSPERIEPEVFSLSGPSGLRCVLGPAVGSASARLVCGERARDVEALFPYATRGLPNENLGSRDLEVELRVEPIRRRFSSELAGARLLAGFLLRQAELDHPRFDRALADATYGIADELVLWVEDTDSLELGGVLDDSKQHLALDLAWKFRSTRSWLAGMAEELSRRPGPPPPAFARLPGEATGAGYTVDSKTEKTAPIRAAVLELADAYLEHERVGKTGRDRTRAFLTDFMKMTAVAHAYAKGNRTADAGLSVAAKKIGWHLTRVDAKSAELERLLAEFDALVRDREIWKVFAKRLTLDPKVLPRTQLLPLRGKGVPAGARALVVTIPAAITEQIRKKTGSRSKVEAKEPFKFVVAVCSDGPDGALVLATADEKDAAERVRDHFSEGKKRLGDRAELSSLLATRAIHGEFFTLLGLLDSFSGANAKVSSRLPNHGETPIVWSTTATSGPPLVLSATITIPSGAMADLPSAAADFLSSL